MIDPQFNRGQEFHKDKSVIYDDQGDYGFLVTKPELSPQEPVAELIVIDEVSLTVGVETGTVYRLGGLTSRAEWQNSTVHVPPHEEGSLSINTDGFSQDSGIGYDMAVKDCVVKYDPEQKVLAVECDESSSEAVKVFSNLIIGLKDGRMNGLYITGL
jgi:hypothetical protein